MEVERLFNVAKDIDTILSSSYPSIEEAIKAYSAGQAQQGYYGVWYSLEQSQNITLQMPLINHDYVMNLVNAPVAGKRLSKRLYQYRDKLAEKVTHNIISGLFEGKSYAEIARRVNEETEASYKQALRITRTEGGRTQSTTTQKGYIEAKKKGIDIKKRWLATLDKKTRHDHRELDGQTVEVDEKFTIRGHTAEGPRLFGVASEDVDCRCTTIEIVDGIAPEVRKDNETKTVIQYKSYSEWLDNKENQAKDAIIGLKTPDGITIESLAAHLYERKDERNVGIRSIMSAIKHPIKIVPVKYDKQGRPSKKYIGDYATIAVNPDDGRVITVHPTSRKKRKKIRSERDGTS